MRTWKELRLGLPQPEVKGRDPETVGEAIRLAARIYSDPFKERNHDGIELAIAKRILEKTLEKARDIAVESIEVSNALIALQTPESVKAAIEARQKAMKQHEKDSRMRVFEEEAPPEDK